MLLFKFREFIIYIKKFKDSFLDISLIGIIDLLFSILVITKIKSLFFICTAILLIMLLSIWILYTSLVVNQRDRFYSYKKFMKADIEYFQSIVFKIKIKELKEQPNKRSVE